MLFAMMQKEFNQKIHIIGSCVTRDVFRVLEKDDLVGKYTARSSLISYVSPPLKFELSSGLNRLESHWERRMIKQDFEKNGLHLNDYIQGILVIDFIDERYGLLQIGNTFITKSYELRMCELEEKLQPATILSRGKQKDFDLWADACQKFTKLVPEQVRKKPVWLEEKQ